MTGGMRVAGGVDVNRQRRIRSVVADVYRKTRMAHCCDPRDLAEAIGLEVRPSDVATAFIESGILRFPNRARLAECGRGIYLALARYILVAYGEGTARDAIRAAALELALPEIAARACRLADLAKIQPHFPLTELEGALMGLHGSGVMAKPAGI